MFSEKHLLFSKLNNNSCINSSSVARKRQRMNNGDAMDMDENENGEVGIRTRSKSRNRSQSHIRGPTRDKSGMRPAEADKVIL